LSAAALHHSRQPCWLATTTQVRVSTQHVASITAIEVVELTPTGEHIVAGFQANDFLVRFFSDCERRS